jgi:TolB protein
VKHSMHLVFVAALAASAALAATPPAPLPIPPTAAPSDSMIRPGERHFAHLWQLTFGGQNAEGYFSADGKKLIWQATRDLYPCDQMFIMDLVTGSWNRVSPGKGRCTCGSFYDHDQRVFWASTFAGADSCPPPPDYSHGYVWPVYKDYDIWTSKLDGSDFQRITDTPGYDAEGVLSPDGQWILYTSMRGGDLDLYKMKTDGSEVTPITHRVGYDGGGWFSRDGKWICWRAYYPADSEVTEYKNLLAQHLVKPTKMNLWVARSDGTHARQVTHDPGASFAPYFTPDGRQLIYASNKDNPRGRNFDLFLVGVNGGKPEPVTRDTDFDGFPMFSPDGRLLVFASNRGGKVRGETNLFLAEWKR